MQANYKESGVSSNLLMCEKSMAVHKIVKLSYTSFALSRGTRLVPKEAR